MTKQEEIEEGIGRILDVHDRGDGESHLWCACYEGDLGDDYPKAKAEAIKEILEYLHFQGVVIKVERAYPDAEGCLRPSDYIDRLHQAGCIFFEPLIEE